jgi:hemoglobin
MSHGAHPDVRGFMTMDDLRHVMQAFYKDVRSDEVRGPVFVHAIGDGDWSAHIDRVVNFWATATRLGAGYHGRDFMPAHLNHPQIRAEHTDRWLEVFEKTLSATCDERQAQALRQIAMAMIENLRIGLQRRDA